MKLIIENWRSFIKEAKWSDSEDEDWPASSMNFSFAKQLKSDLAIIFNANDSYGTKQGMTHGLDSHMIKHYVEFFPSYIEEAAASIIQLIKKKNVNTFSIDKSGNKNPIQADEIKLGDIINTLDHINDKNKNNIQLEPFEKKILNNIITNLSSGYNDITDEIISSAIDISDSSVVDEKGLINILKKRGVVKFKGIYSGQENTYYVDSKNSAMVSQKEDGSVATLHTRTKKQPGNTQDLKTYYKGLKDFMPGKSTVPTSEYSIFNKHMESLKIKNTQPQARKKKKIIKNKSSKQNPMSFALDKIKNTNMPDEQILKALTGKFKLPINAAEQILNGAKRKI